MPDLALATGVKRRSRGSLRPSVLFNMFLEKDEDAPDGFARQSRQGITAQATVGAGPINGIFAKRGVFSDARFTISGDSLYRDATLLGTVTGTGPTSFAASATEVVVTRGGAAYSYNGTNLAAISFPDGASVTAVAYLGGYFFFARAGGHKIYWSSSGDGRTIDGLDFVSAESEPDQLLDLRVVNDSLWALGQASGEVFQLTGDADAVISRVEGMLLKKGIIATGVAADLDNTLFWWGHDNMIYRAGQGVPQRVSDNGIEEQLEGSTLKGMFSFTAFSGHAFLAVRTDSGTFVYDASIGYWAEWATYDRTGWRVSCAATPGGTLVFGDEEDGRIWAFDPDNWDDGDHLERRCSASFNIPGGNVIVHKLGLIGNPGDTPLLTGQGSAPVVEMHSSRDSGKTWGDWRSTTLGAQGRYHQRIEIRRWGLFDTQGGLFEIRVTGPVPFRVSRAFANEPGGRRQSK